MNIILVVFDSLRKDCIGAYGEPPWGKVQTPHLDAFARESVMITRMYPESLPTLPVRRNLYTGRRVYPFDDSDFRLKGDFLGAPGWGPIPEEQATMAEMMSEAGYRTGLIADVYHMFKPSKNYWRGFDQWTFLRGQETDHQRSGPRPSQAEIDHWLPKQHQNEDNVKFVTQCLMNKRDRTKEADTLVGRVMSEAGIWLEQNRDADKFFLTVESFTPHEPWIVPEYYRKMYLDKDGQEQILSGYMQASKRLTPELLERTQANYSGLVTMCDRWFGHFMETVRVLGLLENTVVMVTTDHGHSMGDRDFMGKRGYPASPEVFDVPLIVRFPKGEQAGTTSNIFMQHHDITASILKMGGATPPEKIDGLPLLDNVMQGKKGERDHVTVAWGTAVTVINDKWWLNCKINGTGVLLHDLESSNPFDKNVGDKNAKVVNALFKKALDDAGGPIPDWIMELNKTEKDAPGCSDLAARPE